jgi:hypothetical protein
VLYHEVATGMALIRFKHRNSETKIENSRNSKTCRDRVISFFNIFLLKYPKLKEQLTLILIAPLVQL